MSKLTLPLSLSALIEKIGDQKHLTPYQITSFIKEANISQEDLMDWAHFDHNVNEGYGRKIVHQEDHYEIMVMSWAPFDATAIHDHGYTEWGAVKVFGDLEHVTYEYEDNFLTTAIKEKLSDGDIIYVNSSLIHRMINHGNKKVLSLHVYGTAMKVDSITADSRLYNISNGEIQLVNGGVFHDLREDEYLLTNEDFESDRLTQIEHFTQLLQHYFKTGSKGPQYLAAVNYFHDRSFESRLITELEMDSKRILYYIELRKARKLLKLLSESTSTIDSILWEISDLGRYS
jgi:cysteine dioxygenase